VPAPGEDLYCDDELSCSLALDPHMQLMPGTCHGATQTEDAAFLGRSRRVGDKGAGHAGEEHEARQVERDETSSEEREFEGEEYKTANNEETSEGGMAGTDGTEADEEQAFQTVADDEGEDGGWGDEEAPYDGESEEAEPEGDQAFETVAGEAQEPVCDEESEEAEQDQAFETVHDDGSEERDSGGEEDLIEEEMEATQRTEEQGDETGAEAEALAEQWRPGTLCVARWEEGEGGDGCWYHAVVDSVSPGSPEHLALGHALVTFTDYGNTATCPLHLLKPADTVIGEDGQL
jgi:hypothetical protein